MNAEFFSKLQQLNECDDWRRRKELEEEVTRSGPPFEGWIPECDVVKGDRVAFVRKIWGCAGGRAVITGYELVVGAVEKEKYGEKTGQHTFTIVRDSGERLMIKGRNLYNLAVWRELWADEAERAAVAREKHERGREAREKRDELRTWATWKTRRRWY